MSERQGSYETEPVPWEENKTMTTWGWESRFVRLKKVAGAGKTDAERKTKKSKKVDVVRAGEIWTQIRQ